MGKIVIKNFVDSNYAKPLITFVDTGESNLSIEEQQEVLKTLIEELKEEIDNEKF